ncbi:MAG: xanthine dehydrogenase family protein molybdopterin-binding subunit, partial [Candidatus Bipolaricaulaceae bacterium]
EHRPVGSFLFIGPTGVGKTELARQLAEALGVPMEKIVIYSSDTDFTPFDTGAYASSTTYVSGNAVLRAAEEVKRQILAVAAEILEEPAEELVLERGRVTSLRTGKSVTLEEIGHRATYVVNQKQIAATASFACPESPPPFAAFFCEVGVDTETGVVKVERFVAVADCGQPIHPKLAEGQLEGAVVQGIGHALFEEMLFSERGSCVNRTFFDYRIPTALDVPEIEAILVPSEEPTGPFGAKSIAEVGINGPLPAISNAIYHAVGVRLTRAPFTPARVLAALRTQERR